MTGKRMLRALCRNKAILLEVAGVLAVCGAAAALHWALGLGLAGVAAVVMAQGIKE